ncbi:MAG: helix-turn-helix domain-containing protein [Actinoallomurus sp.]
MQEPEGGPAATQPEEIFGRRLKKRREELGLSQRDLAERMQGQGLDWHQTTVARTESTRRPVRLNEAMALAGILRVPLEELLRPEPDPASELSIIEDLIASNQEQMSGFRAALTDATVRFERAQARYRDVAMEVEEVRREMVNAEEYYERYRRELDRLHASRATLIKDRLSDLKPGDLVDIKASISHAFILPEAEGYRFKLFGPDGGVAMISGPYPTEGEAADSLKHFMEMYGDRKIKDADAFMRNEFLSSVLQMRKSHMTLDEIGKKIGESRRVVRELLREAEALRHHRIFAAGKDSVD